MSNASGAVAATVFLCTGLNVTNCGSGTTALAQTDATVASGYSFVGLLAGDYTVRAATQGGGPPTSGNRNVTVPFPPASQTGQNITVS